MDSLTVIIEAAGVLISLLGGLFAWSKKTSSDVARHSERLSSVEQRVGEHTSTLSGLDERFVPRTEVQARLDALAAGIAATQTDVKESKLLLWKLFSPTASIPGAQGAKGDKGDKGD